MEARQDVHRLSPGRGKADADRGGSLGVGVKFGEYFRHRAMEFATAKKWVCK